MSEMPAAQPNDLGGMFEASSKGMQFLLDQLADEDVAQVTANSFDRITVDHRVKGKITVNTPLFAGPPQFIQAINELIKLTDHADVDLNNTNLPVVEGSFTPHNVKGSLHVVTPLCTNNGQPAVTVRKQPFDPISLEQMVAAHMLLPEMAHTLAQMMRAKLNILVSGGSGAGKTTLLRALSRYISPEDRLITVEDAAELNCGMWLPQTVSLLTYRHKDAATGRVEWEIDQEQLVREALRMRGDRIWVGEVRGKEAAALVKAVNSGHDGGATTIHADDARQATKQLRAYVSEAMNRETAIEQAVQAFDVVIQVKRVGPNQRAITEITQLEHVMEGNEQRRNLLWSYTTHEGFQKRGDLSGDAIVDKFLRNGVNIHDLA